MVMKRAMKKIFPGVSWQNPLLNLAFKAINPVDLIYGRSGLPLYSIRVRSNGVTKQFGGKNFYKFGNQLAEHLETYASLNKKSKVLEIGCGCGRTAFALSRILENGNFVGVDIDKPSLHSCKQSSIFIRKNFRFEYMDVYNGEYNPTGKHHADTYKFPFEDNEFDVIFLVSVFTHMLTDDVKNYISEISRMLKPGGVCMVTTFLLDRGSQTNGISFPYNEKEHYYYNQKMPEVAVGYYLEFFKAQFALFGLSQVHKTLWGNWRKTEEFQPSSKFGQDVIFFAKEK